LLTIAGIIRQRTLTGGISMQQSGKFDAAIHEVKVMERIQATVCKTQWGQNKLAARFRVTTLKKKAA
jgi:hypothetical protein